VPVCMVMGFTGLKTLDDVLKSKQSLKTGAARAVSAGYDMPLILNETLGSRFPALLADAKKKKWDMDPQACSRRTDRCLASREGGLPSARGLGDLRVRALMPFLHKYIPGQPSIVSEFIPGGGGHANAPKL
jgi:hypothetical protein